MGYEQIAIPDDHVLAITGRMARETREEIEALKAATEKAERELNEARSERYDLDQQRFELQDELHAANIANKKLSGKLGWAEKAANDYRREIDDLNPRLADALEDNENLRGGLSKMEFCRDRWEELAWERLSDFKGASDRIKKLEAEMIRLSSTLTEQEACTGREILKAKKLERDLAQKQARAKRQTALLKALRKEVGAETFDKAYQDSLGAERDKELVEITNDWIRKMTIQPNNSIAYFYWEGFPS